MYCWPEDHAVLGEYDYRNASLEGFPLDDLLWRRLRIQKSLEMVGSNEIAKAYWRHALGRLNTEIAAKRVKEAERNRAFRQFLSAMRD